MAAQNDPLDPDWIASHDFDTSFRGYDQTQVRSYLRQVAKSVRVDQDDRAEHDAVASDRSALADSLEQELGDAQTVTANLQDDLTQANASIQKLEAELAEAKASPADLDSAQLTQLLGTETVRVLDSARSAAADIRAKAEREADERTAALDELQRTTNSALTEARKKADDENAKLKAAANADAKSTTETALALAKKAKEDAEVAVTSLRTESEAASLKQREDAKAAADASKVAAQDVAAAVKQRGEEVARDTRLKAESEAEDTRKASEQVKSDAEAEAARLRAEVAADVETARDSAREEARLMLSEAQTLREKVLEDLVKRRRIARQQIDQAKAARDRLARALLTAGQQIDYAVTELDVSVPEAKRAMEQAGIRSSGTEAQQMADIAQGLDQARSTGKQLSPEKVSAGVPRKVNPSLRKQVAKAQPTQKPLVQPEPVPVTQEPVRSEPVAPEPVTQEPVPADPVTSEPATVPAVQSEPTGDDLVVDLVDDGVEAEAGDLDDIFARLRASGKPEQAEPAPVKSEQVKPAPVKSDPVKPASVKSDPVKPDPVKPEPARKAGSNKNGQSSRAPKPKASRAQRASAPERATDPTPAEADEAPPSQVTNSDEPVEILPPFADRDIAITRFGPDLRRKLKRALADDQSDILDRLRRSKQLSSEDLPEVAEQLSGYRKAAEQGLIEIASAGSASIGGGSMSASGLSAMLETLAGSIHSPLRAKVERSVAAADGDAEEVLEPVRAHYRDARSSSLPGLVDDAIAEAFALGAYAAIDSGANVVWVTDPRAEASPDCFDNTLETSVQKPKSFPTGHQRPLGGPGCRCLVLPQDAVPG